MCGHNYGMYSPTSTRDNVRVVQYRQRAPCFFYALLYINKFTVDRWICRIYNRNCRWIGGIRIGFPSFVQQILSSSFRCSRMYHHSCRSYVSAWQFFHPRFDYFNILNERDACMMINIRIACITYTRIALYCMDMDETRPISRIKYILKTFRYYNLWQNYEFYDCE